ncbi:GNAT family N-acetyltransferase [Halegenticoccus soli]|uniref:GNAT family N-acetyltransferase n=1 Tax=Halegenticoccus soli TaxID=1985678 RepID=UPI000C6DE8C7|nr:GNAT family N-acetyltransferase [Halegenticoccus soli]
MLPLWRLTRNRYGRALYESLERVGVKGARMYEYVAGTRRADDERTAARRVDERVELGVFRRDELDATGGAFDELRPGELVVAALDDGTAVGRLFLSVDDDPYVAPLETSMAFEGAYVRRLFVDPDHRGRGIATALVARAVETAREEFGADRATALVAVDNRPSQWVFEANGFRRRRVHGYYRLFGLRRRTVAPVADASGA